MNLNSTHFIKYSDIDSNDTDLFDDAYGFNSEFNDVISFLKTIDPEPESEITSRLIELITGKL
ncbi:MAG: hypothetical protein ACUVTX_07680 [Bacteroidales bacterium]